MNTAEQDAAARPIAPTGPPGTSDWPAFIAANTRLLAPPLVPEIRLHLAEESLPIWRRTEEELGEMNVPPPYWAFAWAGGQALARAKELQADVERRKALPATPGSAVSAPPGSLPPSAPAPAAPGTIKATDAPGAH